jgi:dimethylargininase
MLTLVRFACMKVSVGARGGLAQVAVLLQFVIANRRGHEYMIALTRPVSPTLANCELTHLERVVIDVELAATQHAGYEAALRSLGVVIVPVAAAPEHPDAVFVEDTAIVLDDIAVITRPGATSRRGELDGVASVLATYRDIVNMTEPATLDGGDVIHLGRTLYVGRSGRTNDAGIEQLRRLVAPHDYRVAAVDFSGCLHLKSAATAIGDDAVLLNPDWVSASAFPGCDALVIDAREPHGANALRIGDSVIYSSQYPRTGASLAQRGLRVCEVDLSELAKAEGAVTCCSLVVDQ